MRLTAPYQVLRDNLREAIAIIDGWEEQASDGRANWVFTRDTGKVEGVAVLGMDEGAITLHLVECEARGSYTLESAFVMTPEPDGSTMVRTTSNKLGDQPASDLRRFVNASMEMELASISSGLELIG